MKRTEIERLTRGNKCIMVEYDSLGEYGRSVLSSEHAKRKTEKPDWAGATREQFETYCLSGNEKYARKSEKYLEHFTNVAMEDMALDFQYNTEMGVLDYQAAVMGDPACMYGLTYVETDRAPVDIYLDAWTSCTVPTHMMVRRGIAVLSLVQALSIYRPVNLKIVTGLQHTPTRTDTIQVISAPTNPMDIGRAAWMIAAPEMFRVGMLPMVFDIAGSHSWCGVPAVSKGLEWQRTQLGKWYAKRVGQETYLHIPLMFGSKHSRNWATDDSAIAWVQKQLKVFLPTIIDEKSA